MRAEPVNTSKQVYRLRQDEIVKILFKGQGQAPMSGKKALEGDWLRVLTKDGISKAFAMGTRVPNAKARIKHNAIKNFFMLASFTGRDGYRHRHRDCRGSMPFRNRPS